MSQTGKKFKFIVLSVFTIVMSSLMMACSGAVPTAPPPRVQPPGVEVAVVPAPTPAPPAEPVPTPVLLAPDDGCVECHTNQEMLVDTGDPEEADAESLSEGEG